MLKCPKCFNEYVVRHSYTEAGNQRYQCSGPDGCGHRTVAPLGLHELDDTLDNKQVEDNVRGAARHKRFVITSAQNATPVPEPTIQALEKYCENNNAKLIVIPYKYRNPTSIFADKDFEWWDDRITRYLMDRRIDIADGLTILGDIKVQPTNVKPLTGLEGFTGLNSCIVGHPNVQMKTVPTRQGDMAKILQTTGSITFENYTPTKAGKGGQHRHSYGATVVEIDQEGLFHIRQVSVNKDGTFYDLNKKYGPNGLIESGVQAEALVLGDLHHWWLDKDVDKCIKNDLIPHLNPKRVIMHDAIDGFARSHHHRSNPFILYKKHHLGKDSILQEIKDFIEWQKDIPGEKVLVQSNHHEHLSQYIRETDWRTDPTNAEFYLETALYLLRETKMNEGGVSTPDAFNWWINRFDPNILALNLDESYVVKGVECGLHGHTGPNGARGSIENLSKIGTKCIVGHYHSPAVLAGAMAVGTNSTQMGYARGPSGWLNSQAVIYPDGKRTLIHIIKGKYQR